MNHPATPARRVRAVVLSAGIAAALLLGGAGIANAATPTDTTTTVGSSSVGYNLINQSGDMLVYSHVTGRLPAPNLPILYDGETQNFELPWVSEFGHSSGDAYYTVYTFNGSDSTPAAILDVHFDVAEPDDNTWNITGTTGQPVPTMSIVVTTPQHGDVAADFNFVDTNAPGGND